MSRLTVFGSLASSTGQRCRRILVLALAASWTLSAAGADALRLRLPIACRLGHDCFIQNYFDVDPGPGASDYSCGPLANDGHNGTDFRVRDLTDVARGVPVLAAAAGTVVLARDGVADGFPDEQAAPGTQGRECGNGVMLDHGGGWKTQYCHLRQGSLTAAPGQDVEAGEVIGLVGMSGLAEFPHLHLTVWQEDRAIDPFLGPDASAGCRSARRPLWHNDAARRLSYLASGVLNAGFASVEPSLRGIERGDTLNHPPGRHSSLWFYVRMFGLRPGDRQRQRVFDPQGRLVMEWTSEPAESAEIHWVQPIGRQAPDEGWPHGRYRGEFILIRQGAVVLESFAETDMR